MSVLETVWADLGENPAALSLVTDRADEIPLDSALPVRRLVHDVIAAASLSAALIAAERAGAATPVVELDPLRVATAVTSEKHFRLRGEPVDAWAALSGFWPTADGWLRTHANYPHHRARLLTALGLPESTTANELRARLATMTAFDAETAVVGAGGVAAAVRTEAEWRAHPQSRAVAPQPLLALARVGDAQARPLPPAPLTEPLAGVRVLDLTRVLAGPVATRTLALWGADVLRIDSPRLPEPELQHLDTGAGKRSALLDLAIAGDLAALDALLDTADVVVTGYRSASLDRFGLSPEALAERHPGIVVARLTAWGTTGPWADRRGFDSIVQAASGISWLESKDGTTPGALPAQALDHSAGYLLATGVTTALRRQRAEGGSWLVETSLARVAAELLGMPRDPRRTVPTWEPTVVARGDVTSAAAALHFEGGPDDWAMPPVAWGSSQPRWRRRAS